MATENNKSGRVIFNTFQSTFAKYVNGSVLLILATLLALIVANSSGYTAYTEWLNQPVGFSIGDFNFFSHNGHPMSLAVFINDFLMAIFFLSVGLEIKREFLIGELSTVRKALLPVIGACGGMLVPVVIFYLCCPNDPLEMRGMAIPMATDIAFSLGVLSMFSKRVPLSLKVFLAALAVADDLGGIIVIALFYSSHISVEYLGWSALVVVLMLLMNKQGVKLKIVYLVGGLVLWFCVLHSGIHATVAGVLMAFCIPATLGANPRQFVEGIHSNAEAYFNYDEEHQDENLSKGLSEDRTQILRSIEVLSDNLISPLQDMEDDLRTPVNFFIIPLFAFASAGVCLAGMQVSDLFHGVSFAVLMGLVVGKVVGIFTFSWAAIKSGLCSKPAGATWAAFASVCMLGGIGFTVSMFIADLSYHPFGADGLRFLADAKLGILTGSVLSGVIGYVLLHIFLPKAEKGKS